MPHFKDPNQANRLYFLSDEDILRGGRAMIPESCMEVSDTEANQIRAVQNAPTQEQLIAAFTGAIQKRLDDFAATRRYDNVASLSKYSNLTDAEIASLPEQDRAATTRYRSECRYLLLKTAQTWAVGERILQQVQTNVRPMPSSIVDIQQELPALAWPA